MCFCHDDFDEIWTTWNNLFKTFLVFFSPLSYLSLLFYTSNILSSFHCVLFPFLLSTLFLIVSQCYLNLFVKHCLIILFWKHCLSTNVWGFRKFFNIFLMITLSEILLTRIAISFSNSKSIIFLTTNWIFQF